jgi:hypothetical protein
MMSRFPFFLLVLLISFPFWSLAQSEEDIRTYINQFKDLAIAEQIRMGVPASITLAQGIHESTAGRSELATKGNNHFGIKCKSYWTGETILHDDDKKQECFRKYTSPEQSYIDHSEFLQSSNRYHFLFDLEKTDFAGWASGLKRAGYATNPAYVQKLTELIEKYNLQQYTYEALSKTKIGLVEIVAEKEAPRNLTYVEDPSTSYKGLKGFWASKGETLLAYATNHNIRYARLLDMNELPDEPLKTNMFIFTEKKRKIGTEEFHVVKENETMLLIAQKEAMLLSSLYQFNNLLVGQEPGIGEKLCLQYRSYETPKLRQQFLKELEPTAKANAQPVIVVREETAPAKKGKDDSWAVQVAPKGNDQSLPKTSPVEKLNEVKIVPQSQEKTSSPSPEARTITSPETPVITEEKIVISEKVSPAEPPKTETPLESKTKNQTTEPAKDTAETMAVAPPPPTHSLDSKGVLDEEKAARIEELLNSQPLFTEAKDNVRPVEKTTGESKTNPVAPTPHPVVVPAPHVPERKYDDPGVNDSTKELKRKFDRIIYSQPAYVKREPIAKPNLNTEATVVTPTGVRRNPDIIAAQKKSRNNTRNKPATVKKGTGSKAKNVSKNKTASSKGKSRKKK